MEKVEKVEKVEKGSWLDVLSAEGEGGRSADQFGQQPFDDEEEDGVVEETVPVQRPSGLKVAINLDGSAAL